MLYYDSMTNKIYIKRSGRKSVAIKIDNQGLVTVFCPLNYPETKIQQLISEKRNWILTHLKQINTDNSKNGDFLDYKKLLFGGNSYDITYNDNTIKIGDIAQIKYRKDGVSSLKKWLKKGAEDKLETVLKQWASVMKLSYGEFFLTQARKKWGSCDNKKRIRLNFRLIMLPEDCINYVCIHELSHLLHLNHSQKFWNTVAKYMPNYKIIKKQMKDYSFTLQLF